MSAYVMSREEIRYLVAVAQRLGLYWNHGVQHHRIGQHHRLNSTDEAEGARVGQMLWDENVASVRYRYPGMAELPGPIDCDYQYGKHSISWALRIPLRTAKHVHGVFQLINAYRYQTCEHPAWKDSEAHEFCRFLESALIRGLVDHFGSESANLQLVEDQ